MERLPNTYVASALTSTPDAQASSTSPTSDAFEEGAFSTTAGNPSETPPGEKGPEKQLSQVARHYSRYTCACEQRMNGKSVQARRWVLSADGLLFLVLGELRIEPRLLRNRSSQSYFH